MSSRRAIVIAVDGLRASALGTYGNTWHPTPALDELASHSLVVDWMWCDAPSVEGFYRSVWGESTAPALPEQLANADMRATMVTDDAWAAQQADLRRFASVVQVDSPASESADSVAETEMAKLFAVAIDHVARWRDVPECGPGDIAELLWLHSRGFHGVWDAPHELREQLLAEDELQAVDFVKPPVSLATDDHDELLQYRAAYAAQVSVLDACVGALLEALEEAGADRETLVVLVGCRGYALGEHGQVGGGCQQLYGELLHVPCLVRIPGGNAARPRLCHVIQPDGLRALLLSWFSVPVDDHAVVASSPDWLVRGVASLASESSVAISAGADDEGALRTPAWMLRRATLKDGQSQVELFVKPDDRWEANEVADRCPSVVERLLALLDQPPAPGDAIDADLILPGR